MTTHPTTAAVLHITQWANDLPPSPFSFTFEFSPEIPALGQAGKNPGDLLLIQQGENSQILVSLGPQKKCSSDSFRKAGGQVGKWLRANPTPSIDLDSQRILALGIPGALEAFLEGLRLGAYEFTRHKKKEHEKPQVNVRVNWDEEKIERIQTITAAVLQARDIAHEPANIINPVSLAQHAQAIAAEVGLKCKVITEDELSSLEAGAILAVGQGSQTPPCLIVLEYTGTPEASNPAPTVLVGKALTFDSGGYSLKDTTNIQGMKYDKCGGAAVLSILEAAARLKLSTPIVGVIAAAENMVSSHAYRPDDIITTMSGKTVEIVSTDAEGRLVLADALTYVQRCYSPRTVIDLATLTGGVVVALGRIRAGILANNQDLVAQLIAAGERTGERLWQLPLDDDYLQATKGDDADLKNSGGREGHPIMGGIFLKQFIENDTPWAHLDIAGVADTPKDLPYAPKGATGFGVRLALDYLSHLE